MDEEFTTLQRNHTWTLVPPLASQNLVGCRWIFRIKKAADGKIERYKARLITKGYHQQEGIDFNQTFSSVVKHTTIRLILCLAATLGRQLQQLDVCNAFLQGHLNEDVFMQQPPSFQSTEATLCLQAQQSSLWVKASSSCLVP